MSVSRSCLWALLAVLVACRNGERAPHGSASPVGALRTAELYFSTEVSGYVEPCGCTSEPLGGLPRLASTLRASTLPHALVDAGNLLFPPEGLDEATREQHLYKARVLSRVYRELGAVALNVAHADLEGGLELLKELQHEGAFPLVSANVRPVGEGGPSVARSFLREVGNIKFGLTGVARPESFVGAEQVAVIEYAPVLRTELSRLSEEGAEVLVLLAHVDENDAKELAKLLPKLDLIVRAPGSPITRTPSAPFRVGSVVISEAGSQGQHIGRLTVRLPAKRAAGPLPFDDAGYGQKKERELLQRKLEALKRELAAAPAASPSEPDQRRQQLEKLEARLAEAGRPAASVGGPSLKVELVSLDRNVPSDPAVDTLLAAYYSKLKDMNLEKGDKTPCVPVPERATYVGTAACEDCHEEAYAFWKKTKHAAAWATLEEANKHFDLTCIGCHTIGYKQPGGFCRLAEVGVLKDVGCEMCHGPGSVHVDDNEPTSIQLRTTESTCTNMCHVPEHSDRFDYRTYLREVTGEGHALGGSPP